MSEAHSLQVQELRKRFGRKLAVADVKLSVKSGEIIGLLGPNGAGKTTVFYMIVGFIKPTYGTILLNDKDITSLPMYKRARMGITYLPQEPSVFRKLSVEKNIWAILETRKDLDHKQKREKLEELLFEFGLHDPALRKQPAYTLSGGERRRTEIARALAIEPKFLLLDEPFAGIDPKSVSEIKSIVKNLAKKGIGVLITDHNAYDLLDIITYGYVVDLGNVAFMGNSSEISSSVLVRKVYLGADFKLLYNRVDGADRADPSDRPGTDSASAPTDEPTPR